MAAALPSAASAARRAEEPWHKPEVVAPDIAGKPVAAAPDTGDKQAAVAPGTPEPAAWRPAGRPWPAAVEELRQEHHIPRAEPRAELPAPPAARAESQTYLCRLQACEAGAPQQRAERRVGAERPTPPEPLAGAAAGIAWCIRRPASPPPARVVAAVALPASGPPVLPPAPCNPATTASARPIPLSRRAGVKMIGASFLAPETASHPPARRPSGMFE